MTNVFTRGAWLLLAPAAVAFLLIFAAKDVGAQVFFDPCGSTSVSTTALGAPSTINSEFGIGIGPDCLFRTADDDRNRSNFGGVINFTPEAWGVAADADVPDGANVGTLMSDAVLGLFNNPCRTELGVNFELVDGTTDRTNRIDAKPSGAKDRLSPLADDADSNGVPDGADKWPSYLEEVFEDADPDFSKVHARLFGFNANAVPGLTIVLNFLVFEPGTQVSDIVLIDPRLGYPTVTVLQDPTEAASNEDPINDFCAPLAARTTLQGTADGGAAFRTTPTTDGAYPFVVFTSSQVDADGDGIENSLDPCPYDPDPDWDPRGEIVQDPGDKDGDRLPDSCDPFPLVDSEGLCACGISFVDEDLDGWMNGADNCPLVSNLDQEDAEPDGIGDACDRNPTVRDGELTFVCKVSVVQVGAGGTPAYDPLTLAPCDRDAPLPTAAPSDGNGTGATPTPAPTGDPGGVGGVNGGPDSGVGSLSPVGSGAPLWAFVVLAVSTIGLLAGLGLTTRTIRGQRRED